MTSYYPGDYRTSTQVLCPLTDGNTVSRFSLSDVVALKYKVSVSNDKVLYSDDEDDMMVFDGLCNNCTMDPDSCTIKVG